MNSTSYTKFTSSGNMAAMERIRLFTYPVPSSDGGVVESISVGTRISSHGRDEPIISLNKHV